MKPLNEQINPKFAIQAKILTQITQLLHSALPVECRNHVQVVNIRQHSLMLITDSPVWTTRLRQLSPQILRYVQQNSAEFSACFKKMNDDEKHIIHHIQISTRYHTKNASKQQSYAEKNLHRPELSKKSAELLSQSANSIDHQGLKAALLKLASHSKPGIAGASGRKTTKTDK